MSSEEDKFEADLRASERRRRIALWMVAGAVVALLGWLVTSSVRRRHRGEVSSAPRVVLTPAQQQELSAVIAQSRHRLAELDAPWRAAITAVDLGALPDRSACTVLDWAKSGLAGNPQSSDWGSWPVSLPLGFNGSSIASFSHAPFALRFIAANEEIPALSPGASASNARLDELERGGWSASTLDERKKIAAVDKLPATDVLVRIDRAVEPKLDSGNRFTPGLIQVSAWAFDHEKNRVVCAGIVVANSSPTVDPRSSNLNDDLVINLVRALPSGMRGM